MLLQNSNSFATNALKKATLMGTEYVKAPAVLMVPGEFAGSLGKMKYTKDELSIAPGQWNMKPVVLGHPPSGITTTDYLDKHGLGVLWNVRYQKGKLKADIYLLPDAVDKKAKWLRDKIEKGIPVPISTGLFCEQEKNSKGDVECTNIRPEHLAILEDEAPAFPIQDGVGLNMNKASEPVKNSKSTTFESMTDADRKLMSEAAIVAGQQEDLLCEIRVLSDLIPSSSMPQAVAIKRDLENLQSKIQNQFQYLVQQIKPLSKQDVINDVIRYNINEYVYQSKYSDDFGLEHAIALLDTMKNIIKRRSSCRAQNALNQWDEIEHARDIGSLVDFGGDSRRKPRKNRSKTAQNSGKRERKLDTCINSNVFRDTLRTHYREELRALHKQHNFNTLKDMKPQRVISRVANWAKQENFGELHYDTSAQAAIAEDLRMFFVTNAGDASATVLRDPAVKAIAKQMKSYDGVSSSVYSKLEDKLLNVISKLVEKETGSKPDRRFQDDMLDRLVGVNKKASNSKRVKNADEWTYEKALELVRTKTQFKQNRQKITALVKQWHTESDKTKQDAISTAIDKIEKKQWEEGKSVLSKAGVSSLILKRVLDDIHFGEVTNSMRATNSKIKRVKNRLNRQWSSRCEDLQNQLDALHTLIQKNGLPNMGNNAWENVKDSASTTVARQAKHQKRAGVTNSAQKEFSRRYGLDF